MRSIVVMVAKEPVAARVKTRLCPDLDAVRAAELYTLFVQDMADEMSRLCREEGKSPGGPGHSTELALAYTPEGAEATFRAILPVPIHLFPQQGEDLGERLAHIFERLCGEGYDQVHIINSDSPDMPRELAAGSIRLLADPRTDLVLGPCEDGGYYLVGLKKPHPGLFKRIPWSTERVLGKTLERARELNLSFSLLEPWYDIDTYRDLLRFLARNKKRSDRDRGPGWRTLQYLRAGSGRETPR